MKRPILTECPRSLIWSLVIPLMIVLTCFLIVTSPAQAQLRGARLSDTNFNLSSMQTHGFWRVKRYQKGYTLKRKKRVRRRSYRSRRRVSTRKRRTATRISLPKKKTVRVYRPVERKLTRIGKEKK